MGVPSARGLPACCPGGARCRGGVSSSWGLAWNRRTCRLGTVGQLKWVIVAPWWQEGDPQAETHRKRLSTARHRGGPARNGEEAG